MIKVGICGFSIGNGHPFSFSAIINGYDKERFDKLGWSFISQYLGERSPEEFGIGKLKVTHTWCPSAVMTRQLADACSIPNACSSVLDMVGVVDALIIARDDWPSHFEMAMPFLQHGTPVFIDKPLTFDSRELDEFYPFLQSGKLMTCAPLRNAVEMEETKAERHRIGELKMVSGKVVRDIGTYGIHLLEALMRSHPDLGLPQHVFRCRADHDSFIFTFRDGISFHLDCLGDIERLFRIEMVGTSGSTTINIRNNFDAFRETLIQFSSMVETGTPPIEPYETRRIIEALIMAKQLSIGEGMELK